MSSFLTVLPRDIFRNPGKSLILYEKLKVLWPLFIDGVHLSEGYRATMRQFTFYHSFPRSSWWKDERLTELTLEPPTSFEPRTPGLGI